MRCRMIDFSSAARGNRFTYSVCGHSLAAPYGSDIVCAAVSTLTYLIYFTAKQLDDEGLLSAFSHTVRPGYAKIEFTVRDGGLSRAKFVFDAVGPVVRGLSEKYPKNVNVKRY